MALHNKRDAVVVPASRYPHGYASVRSLAQADVYTIAAVANEELPVTASRFCDEVVLIPPPSDLLAYKDALLGIAARPGVRTIIPHRPQDPYLLSKYYSDFSEHIDPVVPPFEKLRDVHDRKRLMDIAEDAGVPVPETNLLHEVENWEPNQIIKSRYNLLVEEYVDSFREGDSRIAKSVKHIPANKSPDVEEVREEMGHTPIVQEYVNGAGEYVFGALYDHGKPLATFQHRQIRGDSYKGGGGVYRKAVKVPELEEVGRTILDSLGWHGLACIEYVEDADTGEFKIIEINPRMWQSLACATRAGAAFPYWYWLQATNRSKLIKPGYKTGVGTHYLFGELEHLVSITREDSSLVDQPSIVRTMGEILRSCYGMPYFDYHHIDDPYPTLSQVQTELGHAIRRRVK